ncbi:hypothetical protein KIL84_019154 [Mauremys mutica]|uniref:Uncharacterized protein n=1 Tax=Mauremys mutica TaxID=74926 RepID=A0A9D4BAE2_9SAUR|nr:hypothetical protein KIL84_019154 [Mauremys mutica]
MERESLHQKKEPKFSPQKIMSFCTAKQASPEMGGGGVSINYMKHQPVWAPCRAILHPHPLGPTHALSFTVVTLWTLWELLLIYAGAREIKISPSGFNGNSGCARREKSTLNPTFLFPALQITAAA